MFTHTHTPSQVVSQTSTEIKCWTGTPQTGSPAIADNNLDYPSTTDGFRFKGIIHQHLLMYITLMHFTQCLCAGARGVRVHQYRNIGGSSLSSFHSASKYPDSPDSVYSLPSFSTGIDTRRLIIMSTQRHTHTLTDTEVYIHVHMHMYICTQALAHTGWRIPIHTTHMLNYDYD